MKFSTKVRKNMTVKLPASLVQHMNLKPNDIVEVSIEHALISLIAKSEKFKIYCQEKLKTEGLTKHHNVYLREGGLAKLGDFRPWLVKRLKLHLYGLKYWTGSGTIEEVFPDGLLPEVEPLSSK